MQRIWKNNVFVGFFCAVLLLGACSHNRPVPGAPDVTEMPDGYLIADYYYPIIKIDGLLYHFDGRAPNYIDATDVNWDFRPQSPYVDSPPKGFESYGELTYTDDREGIQNDQIADGSKVSAFAYRDSNRPYVIYCEVNRDHMVGPVLFRFATDEMFGQIHLYVNGAMYGRSLTASKSTKTLPDGFTCLGQLQWTGDIDSFPDEELTINRVEYVDCEVYFSVMESEVVYVKSFSESTKGRTEDFVLFNKIVFPPEESE